VSAQFNVDGGGADQADANCFHDRGDNLGPARDDEPPCSLPEAAVPDQQRPVIARLVLGALAVGVTLGYLGSNVMPVLLGGITENRGLSNTAAGAIGTAQLLATAVAGLALTARAGRPGRIPLARWGLVAAAVGFAASRIAPDAGTLGIANVVAGFGLGMVGAMALAALPSTADPDRATAVTVLLNVLGVAVMVAAIPLADAVFGAGGGFLLLAAVCLLATTLMGRLPDAPAVVTEVRPGLADLPRKLRGSLLALGTALFAAADIGLWSYAQIIGEKHANLTGAALIVTLSLGVVTGLLGVVAAARTSRRWRSAYPLVGFLVLGAVAKFLIAVSTSPLVFAVCVAVWNATYPAIVLLLLTIGTGLDVRGRWNAALGGALGLGTAIGPLVAGAALDVGYVSLALVLLGITVVAITLLTTVAVRVSRDTVLPPVGATPGPAVL
jgi:predicted MFS family arabinose efflux permease